jgi:hypothetical protein
MKSLTVWVLAGALLILAAPMAAQAHDWDHGLRDRDGYGWRHRDIVRDRHDIRGDWRDVNRDRYELREDVADGNWRAARAERADIRRDLGDIHRDRWDVYRDYGSLPQRNLATVPVYGSLPVPNNYYRYYRPFPR